ncbi:MAG TPA: GntR family transcriptional regulator [Nocardioides sp.]|uniref:GntR family transcriptional regulator n=1 Tax=uncultured Nocardioides sp. TaxID=198441 RepID=UPI000EF08599|nr:GntR family transcriptional regulator [uncultured Nocardioides sp.]HCB02694.1 GntR family transcriptional regulator [Nocardioides sp.]HRD63953.1 GntR family transcriptional regulator [Nocardioides sp.]HRI95258.1 GntR family transcriptional regulator [Nocardioides sp.]HRK46385.1 GntR family transcriptional regulator [Nocardioides sp.]
MTDTDAARTGQDDRARLAPLDQRTTPDGVHRVMREAILNGTFAPGAQLREAHLAADLGISRAPLREAFSRLEEEGLVERVAFRGAFVAQVSLQTIEEIAVLRYLVEPYAAEQTAARLGDEMPGMVQDRVQALRKAANRGDMATSIDAHLEFHRFFYEHSGNALLAEQWDDWETRLRLFLSVDHRSYDNLDELAAAHEHLAGLIEQGHMERFRTELAHHVHKAPGAALED